MKTENEAHIQSEVSEEIAFTRIHIFAIFLRYLQAEDFLQALLEERLLHLRTENEAYIQKQVSE